MAWKTTTRNTVRQLLPAIGTLVAVRFESLVIECRVIDAKNAYGTVRILVAPLAGSGTQWVELTRVDHVGISCTCGEGNTPGLAHCDGCARKAVE